MSVRTFRNLFCDRGCGNWHDGDVMDGATATEMRIAARRAGWWRVYVAAEVGIPGHFDDVCPACWDTGK